MPIPQPAAVVQSYSDSCTVKVHVDSVMTFTVAPDGRGLPVCLPRSASARDMPVCSAGPSLCGQPLRHRHLTLVGRNDQPPHLFQAVVAAHFRPEQTDDDVAAI